MLYNLCIHLNAVAATSVVAAAAFSVCIGMGKGERK